MSDAERPRHLEEEIHKLKQLIAGQRLDIVSFKAVLSRKGGRRTGGVRSRLDI